MKTTMSEAKETTKTKSHSLISCVIDPIISGGELIIPDGYFVHRIEADADEPYIQICSEDGYSDEKKIPLPKSLAYCLSTHDNGSMKMRENLMEQGRREVRGAIKQAIGL
jgi:hypothetical protein